MKMIPRGIGRGWVVCFCCKAEVSLDGKSETLRHDMASFVENYEEGMKIRGMFLSQGSNCFLDYRDCEPHRVQLKLGACDNHLRNLESLCNSLIDQVITAEKIAAAIAELKEVINEPTR
jgi:hypothetical protein